MDNLQIEVENIKIRLDKTEQKLDKLYDLKTDVELIKQKNEQILKILEKKENFDKKWFFVIISAILTPFGLFIIQKLFK